jgi:deazaflavin-dependent oxidoreductase (nitroreductase family)
MTQRAPDAAGATRSSVAGPGGAERDTSDPDATAAAASGWRPIATQPSPPGGVLRALLRSPNRLYHAGLGWLFGRRLLLLVTTGRKTGIRRETVLEVVRYDRDRQEAVVAAGWGAKTGWYHNVEAGLAQEVVIGRDRFVPEHRVLDVDEAERVFADYERRNRFAAPIVRRVISSLVGWRYDGSTEARRHVVEQLPLVGLRPRTRT